MQITIKQESENRPFTELDSSEEKTHEKVAKPDQKRSQPESRKFNQKHQKSGAVNIYLSICL